MVDAIDQDVCPFCHAVNNCMVQTADDCWCNVVTVPEKLIALVPAKYKARACICRKCIHAFEHDAAGFITSHIAASDIEG